MSMTREELEAKIAAGNAQVDADNLQPADPGPQGPIGYGIVGLPPAGSPPHRSVEQVMAAALTHATAPDHDTEERLVERIITELGGNGVDLPELGWEDDWSWMKFRADVGLNLSGAAMRFLSRLDAATTEGASWAEACLAVGVTVQSVPTPEPDVMEIGAGDVASITTADIAF